MSTNRKLNLFIISTLAVALVILAFAVAPSAAAPTINADPSADYYQRHSELGNPSVGKAVNFSGSDWYQRHDAETASILAVDTTDYFLRHSESLGVKVQSVDTTDYYVRLRDQ